MKEIYLPWKGFNGSLSKFHKPTAQARAMGMEFHPEGRWLRHTLRLMMGRNVHQTLGLDLNTPSEFVVCWTPDGVEIGMLTTTATGGTGQAIRIAEKYNIPVFNLYNSDAEDRLIDYLDKRYGVQVPYAR